MKGQVVLPISSIFSLQNTKQNMSDGGLKHQSILYALLLGQQDNKQALKFSK